MRESKFRTLEQAIKGADVFWACRLKMVNRQMIKSMAKNPIVFVCANPDPEIKPRLLLKFVMMQLLQQGGLIILIKLII